MMTDAERKAAAKEFAKRWKGRGYEKGESSVFWLDLLGSVYGVEKPGEFIRFEQEVHLDHTSFIDGMIPATKVMIEQKGLGKDLRKPIRQSDGSLLTPFEQARRYVDQLPFSQAPRWIVVCNFERFLVYDREHPDREPEEILLKDLPKEHYRLQFLVDEGSEHLKRELEVSIAAGAIVGKLYDAFAKEYADPTSAAAMHSLNVLCVRLVFCLYAEDAGVFGPHGLFHDYLAEFETRHMRQALIRLFEVLNTPADKRDPYLAKDSPRLAAFPYVNGGLFSGEDIEIPPFTDEIRDLLLKKASDDFDWSAISPTIFGAVFESTLNPETRRSGGMHYTSIENIHKVIDPLFLDDLKQELAEIRKQPVVKTRERKLKEFQKKLASGCYLDPACGSGNFLTESYLSLRRLENEVLAELSHGQIAFGFEGISPIRVSLGQFYGIEINDFAVTVAKTALWIAESQMMKETESIVRLHLDFLPLKSYTNIVEGNALRMDWETVVPKSRLTHIMGNPPFVGFTFMSAEQKKDMHLVFPGVKNLDLVAAWYKRASDFIQDTNIECAFVSTNSITQGETVARLWKLLNVKINFAHKTFVWESEASDKAHVHCVIIGFAGFSRKEKFLYQDNRPVKAENINAYLCDAPDILVESRNKPLCDVSKMVYGNKPADGGNLIIEAEEYDEFIRRDPNAKKFIRPLLGAVEYLHGKKRYCLWLKDVSPAEIAKCPLVVERVRKCKEAREASIAAGIRKFATTPTLFAQITQPAGVDYVIVPCVSSERRPYVPMGFLNAEIIVTNLVQIVPNATLYEFGVLTSSVHMAWMRAVCGRLEMRYRYSKDVVYNTFPWPTPTEGQKARIEQTAQAILDARAIHPDCTMAELYDDALMPPELRKAHEANDRAVLDAYGYPHCFAQNQTVGLESALVAELMKLYQRLLPHH